MQKINPQSMVHLTEKPVELASRAILYSSRRGENVLDLFGGGGSTLMACEATERRAHLMELDAPYCDVILTRWQTATGKQAVLQATGQTFDEVSRERQRAAASATLADPTPPRGDLTMGRLPDDAFAQYMAMGPERSYENLASRFKVTKRTITRLAAKEHWQDRLAKIEAEARTRLDDKLAEGIEAMNARHIKTLRVIQSKALHALQSYPLESAMDAVHALNIAIKHERVILGEPNERTAVSIEEIIRRESQRWLGPPKDGDDGWSDAPESPASPAAQTGDHDEDEDEDETDDEEGVVPR